MPFTEMVQAIRDAPSAGRVAVAAELGRVERMETRLGELPALADSPPHLPLGGIDLFNTDTHSFI